MKNDVALKVRSVNMDLAVKYGVNEAFILHYIYYWMQQNKKNNRHYIEGRYWTYNSITSFETVYPFLTYNQIARAIRNLEKQKAIIVGNYNSHKYDRTKWFTLSDEICKVYNISKEEQHTDNNAQTKEERQVKVSCNKESDNNKTLNEKKNENKRESQELKRLKEKLKQELTEVSYNTWIDRLVTKEESEDKLILGTVDYLSRDIVSSRYMPIMKKHCSKELEVQEL